MRVRFHGPCERVTGSCYELFCPTSDVRFLVDCGGRQGEDGAEACNQQAFPFDPASIDFVVLTHAHFDHCALLPRLVHEGFAGVVVCTPATKTLASAILADAFSLLPEHLKVAPPSAIRWHVASREVSATDFGVEANLHITLTTTGHILGAVAATISDGDLEGAITFSGDIGPFSAENDTGNLVGGAAVPPPARFVVMESTYGATQRADAELDLSSRVDRLGATIARAFVNDGRVLLPAFALGRMQDVLVDLGILRLRHPELFERAHVFVASSLGTRVTHTHRAHFVGTRACSRVDTAIVRRIDPDGALGISTHEAHDMVAMWLTGRSDGPAERGALASFWTELPSAAQWNDIPPRSIVVAASGMVEGGRAAGLSREVVRDPKATVVLTGYCSVGTRGDKLSRLARGATASRYPADDYFEPACMQRDGGARLRMRDVWCKVETMRGYSAHADQNGLLAWFKSAIGEPEDGESPPTVFLTHGEKAPRYALAERIAMDSLSTARPVRLILPQDGDARWFDLSRRDYGLNRATSSFRPADT